RSAIAACASRASPACTGSKSPLRKANATMSRIAGSSSTMRMRFCMKSSGFDRSIRRHFCDASVTGSKSGNGEQGTGPDGDYAGFPCCGALEAQSAEARSSPFPVPALRAALAAVQVGVADALAAQLQHDRRDRRDARIDAGAGVVVQVVALLQRVELDQRLLRTAVEVSGLGVGLAGPDRVAGDLAGAGEGALEQGIVAGAG